MIGLGLTPARKLKQLPNPFLLGLKNSENFFVYHMYKVTQKNGNFCKNPTKIEEIQEKKLLTETEPLQLAF